MNYKTREQEKRMYTHTHLQTVNEVLKNWLSERATKNKKK